MQAPKKMTLPAKQQAPIDYSLEKPVLGTMNYARKFPEEATGAYAAPGMPVNVKKKTVVANKNSAYLAMYADGTKEVKVGKGKRIKR